MTKIRNRQLRIALTIAFIAIMVRSLYDSAKHFTTAPADLLWVVIVAVLGGIITAFYYKLSIAHRAIVKRLLFGLATASVTACLIQSAIIFDALVIRAPYEQSLEVALSLAAWILTVMGLTVWVWIIFISEIKKKC